MAYTDEAFGQKVNRTLADLGISGREAARRAGLSNTTIVDMRSGRVPSRQSVIQFVEGLGLDPNEWLASAQPGISDLDVMQELREIAYRLLEIVERAGGKDQRKESA